MTSFFYVFYKNQLFIVMPIHISVSERSDSQKRKIYYGLNLDQCSNIFTNSPLNLTNNNICTLNGDSYFIDSGKWSASFCDVCHIKLFTYKMTENGLRNFTGWISYISYFLTKSFNLQCFKKFTHSQIGTNESLWSSANEIASILSHD